MRLTLLAATAALLAALLAVPAGAVDPALLAGLELRSIGPATMSGRVVALDAVSGTPGTLWVGSATGGLWKSTDGGLTFESMFDDQPVASIGAVAVLPGAPETVWVGTGEAFPRNSVSYGDGVYRSLDGGATWEHLGLAESERIARIVLHPADPDTAWVAALGPAWEPGGERGVYRTRDGGATWELVLSGNDTTGAADLAIDPENPRKLFAALWDYRRRPWTFRSGGPGSGLFVSRDGGDSWSRLTPEDGLPEGDLGRIGIAVAPSDPSIVYALVEAEGDENLLLRSADGGRSFERVAGTAEQEIGNRPFYYSRIHVDPADPDRVYSTWSLISVSDDGGKSWEILVPFAQAHPDHHDLWIDPADRDHLVVGNDGGVYVSRDRGASWRFAANLPLAQLYHVRVDDETPYNVYFGLQDNGSWRGPAEVWENGGIRNHHWQEVFFGDGFDTLPDPDDPGKGWAMSQEGYLARWDVATGERRSQRPAPVAAVDGEEVELRFNWNAGLAIDPFDSDTVYFGSQFVHRSRDDGATWEIVSPDLTTDDPERQRQADSGGLTPDVTGAENFTTIVAIAPSPVEEGVIWVGTDDGRLHLTRDGGGSWESLEGNLAGTPDGGWIPMIAPSRFDAGEAFVVVDDHRRGDVTPYVQHTTDFGASWESLSTDTLRGYALSIAQDPVERDLLWLGTELGLWLSLDGGASWLPFRHGIPAVSVMDLAIQETDDDLVVGTHGRGVFVLDDLDPLRTLSAEALSAPLHLFPAAPAQQYRVAQTGSSRFPGDGEFRGANEPYGAVLTFALAGDDLPHPDDAVERERREEERRRAREEREAAREAGVTTPVTEEAEPGAVGEAEEAAGPSAGGEDDEEAGEDQPKVEIEVADAAGEVIRRFDAPVTLGINRAVWNLRRDPFAEPESDDEDWLDRGGPEVLPGTYTVTVRRGDAAASTEVEVVGDPRFDIPRAEREARQEAILAAGALQETATEAIERIRRARSDVETALAKARDRFEAPEGEEEAPEVEELEEAARELEKGLAALERRLWAPPKTKGIVAETDAWSKIRRARWLLSSAWDAPTPAQLGYLEEARAALAAVVPEHDAFFAEEVAAFRERVRALDLELLPVEEPLAE